MNCLIILLLLACGGCQNGCGCGCGRSARNDNNCCRDDRGRDNDCSCRVESRVPRGPRMSEEEKCDHRQGGPVAWNEGREGRHNNYPSISGDESCGCDAE